MTKTSKKPLKKVGKKDWDIQLELLIEKEAKCMMGGKGRCYLNEIYRLVESLFDKGIKKQYTLTKK